VIRLFLCCKRPSSLSRRYIQPERCHVVEHP
jgi:hypothetical protein